MVSLVTPIKHVNSLHSLSEKNKAEGTLPKAFCEASITLIQKPGKEKLQTNASH